MVVQLYFSSPTLFYMLGNAQKSAGGLSQITGPVQGQSMVQGAWAGYAGTFNKPSVIPGLQNYQFNTSYFLVPVPLVMGESLIQSTEAVLPILEARMNDVYAVTVQQMSQAVFSNNTANPLMPSSFVDGFDDGTNVATYGGINRNGQGNQFWRGQYFASSGAILTRAALSGKIIQVTDAAGGQAPKFIVLSPIDFATLQAQFIGTETNYIVPGKEFGMDTGTRSGFPSLNINGIPIFMDHFCPAGNIYMVNTDYTAFYLSEDAPFAFSGFYSTVPLMQVAQVGVMICGYQNITSKPVANAHFAGVTGGSFGPY